MNRIITIGRQFGSGGRELGKRLAELLGYAYYDKEIIAEISKRTQLAESYVKQVVEQKPQIFFPITTARSFHDPQPDYLVLQHNSVYSEQVNVLNEMAEKSSCVIVGRCADYILKDKKPFRLFVYSDMDAKMARCRKKAGENENLSDKALKKKIFSIDRNRAKYYKFYTGKKWGAPENYDLCINTASVSIKEVAKVLAELLKFEEQ